MVIRRIFLRSPILLSALLALTSSEASAVCNVPRPRRVCAELANSQAVVVARLVAKRTLERDVDPDASFYSLETVKLLHGEIPRMFEVSEKNDSGRATFEWNPGQEYVLFLSFSGREHAWALDGCGNSQPLSRAASVLAAIDAAKKVHSNASISGMVSTESWTTGVPGVELKVTGAAAEFRSKTDAGGRFEMRVPAGVYTVEARGQGRLLQPEPFSYEDPRHLTLGPGDCAQVQFSGIAPDQN
jgi:hypothetical protein